MKNPRISVIIPVYNAEKTLRQCLNSVIDQTYKNYEVIVVNNNSTDKTKDIIKKFQKYDKKIKYAFEEYQSRGAARNRGIIEAKGKIIAMIDADCIAPKDWIEKIIKPLIKNNEKIVVCNELIVRKDFCSKQRQRSIHQFINNRCNGDYVDYFDTKACAFKKSIITNIGSFNQFLKRCEDVDFGIRLLSKNIKIVYLKDYFIIHNSNLTLYNYFKIQITAAYWINKCFKLHKNSLNKLPKHSYDMMNLKEFLSFFYSALCSLIFKKNKSDVFFDVLAGIAYRIGVIKSIIRKEKYIKNEINFNYL